MVRLHVSAIVNTQIIEPGRTGTVNFFHAMLNRLEVALGSVAAYASPMSTGTRGHARSSTVHQLTTPITTRSRPARPSHQVIVSRTATVSVAVPLFIAAVHWLIVQVTASLAFRYGRSTGDSRPFSRDLPMPPEHSGVAGLLVDPLRNWDGLWYRLVAIEGYNASHKANAAFWPLFPWIMRALSNLTGVTVDVAGYLLANVCFAVALVLLYRLVALDFDVGVARATLWAIALFPTSLFFSAVYTESPFLMLAVGSLYAARRGNWWMAGVVGALAALTRSYGMFLVFPLGILFLQERGFYIRRLIPTGIATALPLAGPAIFSWHLDRMWGDYLAWKHVQEQWNRFSARPWETMRYAFSQSPEGAKIGIKDGADWSWLRELANHPNWSTVTSEPWRKLVANSDTLELVCTLSFFGLALIGIWKLPLYQSVYLLPGLIVPLFEPSSVHVLMSMPRFGLTLFPLFVVIGVLLASRKAISLPLALLSTAGLVLLTIQFSQWYWVS